MVGPFGYDWYFLDLDLFSSKYPQYFDEFKDEVFADDISETDDYDDYYGYDDDYYYSYSDYDDYYYSYSD